MLPTLTVERFMSRDPYTIGADQPLTVAHRIMRSHRIRHLPVLVAGKLVGMVSERDLTLIETMRGVNPDMVTVEEAMTPTPYVVGPEMSIATVALEMAQNRYGSAVVMSGGQVVGIFTTVDALQALLWTSETQKHRVAGVDPAS